ncbi:LacI family DNA-binding transcriptional regulator [Scrofimicrobium canadense]|nr:LacI family DNA-binding transcriptional regulator [Scrofimicrobium canadense]
MRKRPATMNHVAERAGVSLKTVSRYVNGETNIAPELGERIAAAIAELGYRRNLAAASIRPGQASRLIGLIISDLANPYYSALAAAAEQEVMAQGYVLVVSSSTDDIARYDHLVSRLVEQRVDGLIIVPPRGGHDRIDSDSLLSPAVFLDRPPLSGGADCVLADNRGGARSAIEALLNGGLRQVAFLSDSLEVFTIRERWLGYLETMACHGVDPVSLPNWTGAHSREEAKAGAIRLLQETEVEAFFTANNRATLGALEAMQETGIQRPIIGFDDFESASLIGGGISVVRQPVEEMGRAAAQMLLAKMTRETSQQQQVVLPTELVLRGSEAR